MINLPPLHSSRRIEAKAIPAVLKSWQIGQILESRAKTSSNAQGELQIQVGQHVFDAKTKTPIVAGENLSLQVSRLGDEPLLKILGTAVKTDPVTLFLRQAIPQPTSIKTLFNLLNNIDPALLPVATKEYPEVSTLTKQLEQLLQLPIKRDIISANEIQQFLQKSGFNLENQILNQQVPSNNLKLELIQIKQTIDQLTTSINKSLSGIEKITPEAITTLISTNKPAAIASLLLVQLPTADKNAIINYLSNPQTESMVLPRQLLEVIQSIQKMPAQQIKQLQQWIQFIPTLSEIRLRIEQSLNTITNHQLQAVQADADSAFMVIFNLLVAKNPDWIDLFNIRITKEETNDDNKPHWQVIIQMQLPDLGPVEAKLILVNNELHTAVTSELDSTHQLIQQHINILETALSNAGFNVATMTCKQQAIKPIDSNLPTHRPLLDDKA